MGKLTLDIIDHKNIEGFLSFHYLYILIAKHSLSYLVCNKQREIVLLRNYELSEDANISTKESEIQEIIDKDDFLKADYDVLKVSTFSRSFTLVPKDLYEEDKKSMYLRFMLPNAEHYVLENDYIDSLSLQNLYFKKELLSFNFYNKHNFSKSFHYLTPLLLGYRREASRILNDAIFVHFKDNTISIVAYKHAELVFCNIYEYKHSNDVVYFIFLAIQHCKFDINLTQIYLTGNIVKDSEIVHRLKQHLPDVAFLENIGLFHKSPIFQNISDHYFFDLQALSLC